MNKFSDNRVTKIIVLLISAGTLLWLGYVSYIDFDKLKAFFTFEYLSFLVAILLVIPFLFYKKGRYARPVFLLVSIALFGFLQYACPRPTGAIEIMLYNHSKGHSLQWHLFIKVGFILALSLLFAKYYCGWICPKGIIQEYLYSHRFKITIPDKLDKILKWGKYITLILLIASPILFQYKLFRDIGPFKVIFNLDGTTYLIIFLAIVLLSSIFIERAYCRYFCPFGALLGILSFFSFNRIRFLDTDSKCRACNLCANVCPTNAIERATKTEEYIAINSFECITCKECIKSCPHELIYFGSDKSETSKVNLDKKTKPEIKGGLIK